MSRLDELGASRRDCDLRLSDGGRTVSAVGETDIGLLQRGGSGDRWNMEIGFERTRLKAERTISGV